MSNSLKEFLNESNEWLYNDYNVANIARRTIEVLRHEDSPFAIIGEDGWPIESHQIGQWPDYQCRMIKKHCSFHWINSPHHLLTGPVKAANVDDGKYIIHYEKDDYRDRVRIEKKWLRAQARRKQLGLEADVFECRNKPEFYKYSDPDTWLEDICAT